MYLNIRLWQCCSNRHNLRYYIIIFLFISDWQHEYDYVISWFCLTRLRLLKFQPEMTKWKINYIIPKTFQISSFHLIKRRQKMLNEDGWNLYLLIQIGANIHTHVLLIHQSVVCSTWWWLCVLDSSCIIYMIYIKKRLL